MIIKKWEIVNIREKKKKKSFKSTEMGKLKDLNDSPNRQKYSSGTQQSQ